MAAVAAPLRPFHGLLAPPAAPSAVANGPVGEPNQVAAGETAAEAAVQGVVDAMRVPLG